MYGIKFHKQSYVYTTQPNSNTKKYLCTYVHKGIYYNITYSYDYPHVQSSRLSMNY